MVFHPNLRRGDLLRPVVEAGSATGRRTSKCANEKQASSPNSISAPSAPYSKRRSLDGMKYKTPGKTNSSPMLRPWKSVTSWKETGKDAAPPRPRVVRGRTCLLSFMEVTPNTLETTTQTRTVICACLPPITFIVASIVAIRGSSAPPSANTSALHTVTLRPGRSTRAFATKA